MRAIVAKRLRRQAYGCGHHPGPVKYFQVTPKAGKGHLIDKVMQGSPRGFIIADPERRKYQGLKRGRLGKPCSKTSSMAPAAVAQKKS